MRIDTYQSLAERTHNPDMTPEQIEDNAMLGMIGELGEFTELFKKKIMHGKELDPVRVVEEAGDFLWYITHAATGKKAQLAAWVGLTDFIEFDDAAKQTLDQGMELNPAIDRFALSLQPAFFFQLAKAVPGLLSVSQVLTILAVILAPFGGLDAAARGNIRKLEARHNLPVGDLEAVSPIAVTE